MWGIDKLLGRVPGVWVRGLSNYMSWRTIWIRVHCLTTTGGGYVPDLAKTTVSDEEAGGEEPLQEEEAVVDAEPVMEEEAAVSDCILEASIFI